MTTLITLVSIAAYIVAGGFVGGSIFRARATPREQLGYYQDNTLAGLEAFFGGIAWPATLPLVLGFWLAYSPERKRERKEAERKRIAELERELGMEGHR